jgi:DNA-directed RNA polymerase subunit beta'
VVITDSEGENYETLIPKWRHITVFEGEFVEKGETIAEGELTPHDILRLRGVEELADYLVKEIQDVYRLQGVGINDKHIEAIIRQMLRKVDITAAGETDFFKGEQVERSLLNEVNDRMEKEGWKKKEKFQRVMSLCYWVLPKHLWLQSLLFLLHHSRKQQEC